MVKTWVPNYKVPAWARRSRYYLMEFIAALLGLAATAYLLDRAVFALTRYLSDANAVGTIDDRMNLGVVAALLVVLPLTLVFYKRSRFEELDRPPVAKTKLRRFFLYIFMLVMLLNAVGFMVAAIYSALMIAFGAAEIGETLLRQTAPALLAAMIHGYIFRVFMKTNSVSQIKEFTFTFGLIGTVLFVALLVMTSIQARSSLIDQKTSRDLHEIGVKVDEYYRQNNRLPARLEDLDLDKSLDRRASRHNYTYQTHTTYSYQLCATFKSKSSGSMHDEMPRIMPAERVVYPTPVDANFSVHDKGHQCFDVAVGSQVNPYDTPASTGAAEPSQEPLISPDATNVY